RCLIEMAAAAKAVIRASGVTTARVLGAGVATMGVVDRTHGVLVDPSYLGWSPLDIAKPLQARLDLPVVVDRIANTLLAAEMRKTAGRLRNAVLINVGFVLTAAFLVEGVLARGETLLAGQIGHMRLAGSERRCPCGQRGCLNVVASGWAAMAHQDASADLELSAAALHANRPLLAALLRREAEGDRTAYAALGAAGHNLGRALRSLKIALDPARLFLAGPVGRAVSFV